MATMSKAGEALVEALRACVAAAPESQRNTLAQAIENYAEGRGRAFRTLFAGDYLPSRMMDALVEETDARPEPGV